MLLGGAAAPRASQWLMNVVGWRWTFVVFAMCGAAWAVAFYWWFRDDPAEHPATNEAERILIAEGQKEPSRGELVDDALAATPDADHSKAHGPIPWGRVFPSANIWLLSALVALSSAMYELFSGWYPTYLQRAREAPPNLSSWLASMVLGAGAVATISGGWFSDWLVRRTGNHRWGRTAQAVAGWGIAALGILASIRIDETTTAAVCLAVAAFGLQLALPSWWACATQISGRHVGALFGMMNMFGSVGRIAANAWVGWFADWRKSLGYAGRASGTRRSMASSAPRLSAWFSGRWSIRARPWTPGRDRRRRRPVGPRAYTDAALRVPGQMASEVELARDPRHALRRTGP